MLITLRGIGGLPYFLLGVRPTIIVVIYLVSVIVKQAGSSCSLSPLSFVIEAQLISNLLDCHTAAVFLGVKLLR